MKVLVADKFPDKQLEKLRKRGHDVRYEPEAGPEGLPHAIADTEVLVVRSTEVSRETIEEGQRLGLIVRAGAGTNTIDVEAASERGVYVCNVPGKNSIAVAELTMGLVLALDRRIPDNVAELREENWRKSEFSKARGLMGRRLGIVGLGSIGIEVATRARAFGMKVVGVEREGRSLARRQQLDDLGVKLYPDLDSMLPNCDVVTIHVPSTSETRGLVDKEFLSKMKDGASLINTSRGDIVVADDLLTALNEQVLWVALDVFPEEPVSSDADFDSELAKHPRVYGTHHIGASTEQAQEAIARQVIRVIDDYCDGGIRNAVNLAEPMEHTTVVGIRHVDRVGVLSQVFSTLRGAGINVEHMENHIFKGAHAAKAVMHVHGDFNEAIRKELADLEAVFDVTVLRETD
ncbi:MAG TPA: NAD(P)-dependent oxidoreductase [Acidimicrobiia bacterium]|nr:NAD(P)-dependent oxidoreductase [Acidimicrobiia bacterium]